MKRINKLLVGGSLIILTLIIFWITIMQPTGILKFLYNSSIFGLSTQNKLIDIIPTSTCKNHFKSYYKESLTPNNNANLLEALELFYIAYENAFKDKPVVNRKQELYRNQISNIFKLLVKRLVVSTSNNDLAIVDLGIGNYGLYTLVAVSLGYQVVSVSSDFCSFEILLQSIKNISNTLTGCTPLEKITCLYNAIRQVSCIKIPHVSQNCYNGNSFKHTEKTHLASIRLSDIVFSNTFKKFILSVDLKSIAFSILFDDLKNIMVRKYEIPTIILTNWNKVNKSIQNQIIRFLREKCYSPHLSPTISAELQSGFPWPNELYWFSSPACNLPELTDTPYLAYIDNISNSKVNCLEWFPTNNEVERLIEQSNFHEGQIINKLATVPIYIYDPNVDYISGNIAKMNTWENHIYEQIIVSIQTRADLHYIDIGSNIGTLALPIAVASKRKVIAIDANLQNLLRISKSAKFNKLNSIYFLRNAITDLPCIQMQMEELNYNNVGGWRAIPLQNFKNVNDDLQSNIKSATFDNLVPMLASIGIKQAVLKIDIEGGEYSAFHSALQFFKIIDVPYVFMEWGSYGEVINLEKVNIPNNKLSEKYKQQLFIKRFFSSLGYEAYSNIYSKQPYVEDEPRAYDIVLKKQYV